MALRKSTVSMNFTKGVDLKGDPKQVSGKLLVLENAIFQSVGRFKKRNGFSQIGNPVLTKGNSISSYANEAVVSDGTQVYSYSAQQNSLNAKGPKVAVDLESQDIVKNNYEQKNADSTAHPSGLSVFAWEDSSGGVRYSVADRVTGQLIVANALVSAVGSKPKVVSIGSTIVIFFLNATDPAHIFLLQSNITVATPSLITVPVNVSAPTSPFYDASVFNNHVYLAFQTGVVITVISLTPALVQDGIETSTIAPFPVVALSIFGDEDSNVWLVFGDTSGIFYVIFNPALVLQMHRTVISNDVCVNLTGIAQNKKALIFYEMPTQSPILANADEYTKTAFLGATGVILSPTVFLRSVGLASKPWIYSGTIFIGLTHDSYLQPIYFVADQYKHIAAKVGFDNTGGGLITSGMLPEANSLSSSVFQFTYLSREILGSQLAAPNVTASISQIYTQTGVSSVSLAFDLPQLTEAIGKNLHISGGILSAYDGAQVVEHGFHLYPEYLIQAQRVGGGGILLGTITNPVQYQYCAVYEWKDSQGQIHRSAPSIPVTFKSGPISITGSWGTTSPNVVINDPADLALAVPGFQVVGDGIPAGTLVSSVTGPSTLTLDHIPTSTGTNAPLTLVPVYSMSANLTNSERIALDPAPSFFIYGFLNGNTITVDNPTGLSVGMTVYNPYIPGNSATILSINGNTVTMSVASTATGNYAGFRVTFEFSAVTTAGSPTINGVPTSITQLLYAGQRISCPDFPVGTVIAAVGTTSVVMNTNSIGGNGRTGFRVTCYLRTAAAMLRVGQTFALGSNVQRITKVSPAQNQLLADVVSLETPIFGNSSGYTATISNMGSNYVYLPTLRLTEKQGASSVRITVYRTLGNQRIFHRCSSLTAPIYNDVTVDYVGFYDTLSDYELASNEQLYTTGGEVENMPVPATSVIGTFKNRLLCVPSEDPVSYWMSKQVLALSPVEFSDVLIGRLEEAGGAITAIQQMDDKLILFKSGSIYYTVGEGPSPNGANNDMPTPQRIPSDVGCINKKSIVLFTMGIIFQSAKGIYLLDRALALHYIGADVESYNSDTVTSAQLILAVTQVRFSMLSGVMLVFDYYTQQWSVFTHQNAIDSTIFRNLHTYLTQNGLVFAETPGLFTDNGNFIGMKIQTGWLSLAGLQGFQRIYELLLLGEYISQHSLTLDVSYDFNPAMIQTVTIDVAQAPARLYQYRVLLAQQKCESVRFTITENQLAPFGEGLNISAIALLFGVKPGLGRMGAAKTYG